MNMEGPWCIDAVNTTKNHYQFNGIERFEDLDLNIDFAFYRSYNAAIGRWWQVDPEAERFYGMSVYTGMGNNPVMNVDPEGDAFFAIPQISFNGGFSFGLEIGVGLPGVLSASVTVGAGAGGAYWSAQGFAGGFYAGYGSGGAFAGVGYQYAGFSGGLSLGSDGLSLNAGYGVGGEGLTTSSASGGLSYNLSSGQFGYNIGVAHTHIFEKPIIEHLYTYENKEASKQATKQRASHNCFIGACEYLGPYSYELILLIIGNSYTPGKGTKTLEALETLYTKKMIRRTIELVPEAARLFFQRGESVLVAKNRNHAIVLNKIEKYKLTYKYRRYNEQKKYKFTYMNPATKTINTTGMRQIYKYPTYYIRNRYNGLIAY